MTLRYKAFTTGKGLRVLRHCYQFVESDWQPLPREALPDQGFELLFRRSCVMELNGWQISQEVTVPCG